MRALTLLVLAGVLAGAAHAAAGDPERRHTTRDMAHAKSVLLRPAELGKGWTSTPGPNGPLGLTCPTFQPRQSDLVETGAAASPNYRGSPTGPFVSQVAWVYRTERQAATLWQRTVRPQLARCLAEVVAAGSTRDVTFEVVKSGELALPKVALRTAGFRVSARFTSAGRTGTPSFDMIVLASGRTITQITFADLTGPIPSAVELTLARAVARRLGTAAAA